MNKHSARISTSSVRHASARRYTSQQISRTLLYVSVVFLALLFLVPLLGDVVTALKTIAESNAFPAHLLPQSLNWQSFSMALTMIDYGHYTLNSLELAGMYTVLVTFTSVLVGFGFARLRGPGKRVLFLIMLSTMMVPPILTVIPTYVLFSRIGIVNTYWPWVLWGLASSPFLAFLSRQFFAGIPAELEDAAILDGCGYWRIFWQIFLPLSKPVLATAAILSFTFVWGDFFAPAIFLNNDNTTLAVAMSYGYGDSQNHILPNVLAAGVLFYVLPVVVLFFFAQRLFIRGIATAGLKG